MLCWGEHTIKVQQKRNPAIHISKAPSCRHAKEKKEDTPLDYTLYRFITYFMLCILRIAVEHALFLDCTPFVRIHSSAYMAWLRNSNPLWPTWGTCRYLLGNKVQHKFVYFVCALACSLHFCFPGITRAFVVFQIRQVDKLYINAIMS